MATSDRSGTAAPLHTLVCERGTRIRRKDGAVLFRIGDHPRTMFAIVSGTIRVERPTEAGGRIVVEKKGPGELIGEYGPLDGAPRSADAVAEGAVELMQLSSDDFVQLLHDVPETAVALARTLAVQLRGSLDRTHDRNAVDITTRLARRLIDLSDRFGQPVDDGISIEISQADLAGWVGATREATARSLGKLRTAGLVRTARRVVIVLDADGIARVAETGTVPA